MQRRPNTRYQHLLLGDSDGIDEGIIDGMAEGWPEDEGRRPHDESRMAKKRYPCFNKKMPTLTAW